MFRIGLELVQNHRKIWPVGTYYHRMGERLQRWSEAIHNPEKLLRRHEAEETPHIHLGRRQRKHSGDLLQALTPLIP